jgi:biotin carboxyl carrier protein
MNKIKINDNIELAVAAAGNEVVINDKAIGWDMQELANGTFSILADGRSYNAVVEHIDRAAKQLRLRINGNVYDIAIQGPIDQLLQKMGLNFTKNNKVESIKAPMPGLVLKILVTEGQQIAKGDPVLILEAMKMENVFKAPAAATVKAIKATEGKAVEKGEVLIELA